jgi:hypothetical protein
MSAALQGRLCKPSSTWCAHSPGGRGFQGGKLLFSARDSQIPRACQSAARLTFMGTSNAQAGSKEAGGHIVNATGHNVAPSASWVTIAHPTSLHCPTKASTCSSSKITQPFPQGGQSNTRGGPFAVINGAMAEDVVVVALPAGAHIERPLHVVHVATAVAAAAGGEGRALSASAPRLLIALSKGAQVEVIEEFVSATGGEHAVFAVAEVVLDTEAMLKHGYVQREAAGSVHFKSTLVDQAEGSCYSLVETRVGGGLSRHDVGVAQGGPETTTRMRHFLLAGASQLQDLHSKLVLDHPRGEADQLHKCIVSHASGRGVFDGNVKVGTSTLG